jgi:hypothetical protein
MAKRRKCQGAKPNCAPVNFVHLHGLEINKSATHRDRRKEAKRGKEKHKTDLKNRSFFCLFLGYFSPLPLLSDTI